MGKMLGLYGPSGAGKTTLGSYLKEIGIPELISTTTRQPRLGEKDGVNYYFVTLEEFKNIPMIEFTEYPEKSGKWYGTSYKELDRVLEKSSLCFAVLDTHGIEEFKDKLGDRFISIYIYSCREELEKRMLGRGDSPSDIEVRLRNIDTTGELDKLYLADYCIVNNILYDSLRLLETITELNR